MYPRLPRFRRVLPSSPMQMTERDREIIRAVHRHRFLRSSHIISLVGGSAQQVLRRLQLLFHQGYLERPRCQLDYYYQGGSREIVYGLGDKGAAEVAMGPGRWSEKNRSVRRPQLEHWLMVADFMVSVETACRQQGVTFTDPEQMEAPRRAKLGLIPDRLFMLDSKSDAQGKNRTLVFLEADRGTMPVMRATMSQTSVFRKLRSYVAAWEKGIHRDLFGSARFRVLLVTTSEERLASIANACLQLERGRGLFLLADWATIQKGGIMSPVWRNGRGESERMFL